MLVLSHKDLFVKYNIDNTDSNKVLIKSILTAMTTKELSKLVKQKIMFDEDIFYDLYKIYLSLSNVFDITYNSRNDLEKLFIYILNAKISKKQINFFAVFCPGYTANGYKSEIGKTTSSKLIMLGEVKEQLNKLNLPYTIKCVYSDVFLENCDENLNSNWKKELDMNKNSFLSYALKIFDRNEIIFLSDIFFEDKYIKGFVDSSILKGTLYDDYYVYNKRFYNKMGWNDEQIKYRNDKLYTIYNILANYLLDIGNIIYLPMENMYNRTKVFTKNNVCSMYFKL